jgi:hypothetical protein
MDEEVSLVSHRHGDYGIHTGHSIQSGGTATGNGIKASTVEKY